MCTVRKKVRMLIIKMRRQRNAIKHGNTAKHGNEVPRIKHRNTARMHRRNRDLRPPAYQKTLRSQACMNQRMTRKHRNKTAIAEAGCWDSGMWSKPAQRIRGAQT
jgi:hypothetical protein